MIDFGLGLVVGCIIGMFIMLFFVIIGTLLSHCIPKKIKKNKLKTCIYSKSMNTLIKEKNNE